MKNKKVVITGGAGFIGAHLAKKLAPDNSVIILDNLATGKKGNIAGLLGGNVTFVNGSINDLPLLRRFFKGIDFVFHLAAIASVPRSVEEPVVCHEVNATGTLNVLLAARDSGVKKVVFASSCAVYGDRHTPPIKEEMAPHPQSPYAVTKLAGEYYCQAFQEVYGLTTVCLRYFNVYGPGQDPNSAYAAVVPKFIQRIAEGKPLVILGDGEQTRDFVFVKDVVQANILAAQSDASGIFNIGSGRGITMGGLAKLIIRLMGKDVGITYQRARAGDVRHSLADISQAKLFGYQPEYTLERGLRETINNL
jgi:UDP-glucose 4-epimerase